MSYSYTDTPTSTSVAATSSCCSSASSELKLYQAFVFSVPIFFTFILLFLFYLLYLRRRRVDWSVSLQMRASYQNNPRLSELGLKKELREMLPIIVFNESFSIREPQCSVCLGDYQSEDRLQQIPVCGHTFHMDCIDHWLATHTTCPLCRLSLAPASKSNSDVSNNELETRAVEGHNGVVSEQGSIIEDEQSQSPPSMGSTTIAHEELHELRTKQSEQRSQDSVAVVVVNIEGEEVGTRVVFVEE